MSRRQPAARHDGHRQEVSRRRSAHSTSPTAGGAPCRHRPGYVRHASRIPRFRIPRRRGEGESETLNLDSFRIMLMKRSLSWQTTAPDNLAGGAGGAAAYSPVQPLPGGAHRDGGPRRRRISARSSSRASNVASQQRSRMKLRGSHGRPRRGAVVIIEDRGHKSASGTSSIRLDPPEQFNQDQPQPPIDEWRTRLANIGPVPPAQMRSSQIASRRWSPSRRSHRGGRRHRRGCAMGRGQMRAVTIDSRMPE